MAFPHTRHTLIQRLASGGSEIDWREFLDDYWGPVCRFVMRHGSVTLHDAEEIASQAFEVVLRKSLLKRWSESPRAKLRTLLCAVTCRVQANFARASSRRAISLEEKHLEPASLLAIEDHEHDFFYAAWVGDLLQKCLNDLVQAYHCQGRGDYVRVLYGRSCEGLTIAEVAEALDIPPSSVDNFYRHAKKKLTELLRAAVQSHVIRYSNDDGIAEFKAEWGELASYLSKHGGLEEAIRNAEQLMRSSELAAHQQRGVRKTLTHCGLKPSITNGSTNLNQPNQG